MLGRVAYMLRAKDHMRGDLESFRSDWSLLLQARNRINAEQEVAENPSQGLSAQ